MYIWIINKYILKFEEVPMTKPTKKQVNLRLKDTVTKELQAISKKYRISQADVVAILIHWCHTDGEDIDRLEEAFSTAESL